AGAAARREPRVVAEPLAELHAPELGPAVVLPEHLAGGDLDAVEHPAEAVHVDAVAVDRRGRVGAPADARLLRRPERLQVLDHPRRLAGVGVEAEAPLDAELLAEDRHPLAAHGEHLAAGGRGPAVA